MTPPSVVHGRASEGGAQLQVAPPPPRERSSPGQARVRRGCRAHPLPPCWGLSISILVTAAEDTDVVITQVAIPQGGCASR